MSATSLAALAVIDLTIVAMAAVMIGVAAARGMFEKGSTPRTGRVLIAAGIVVTAAYCLADFFALTVLPSLAGDELQRTVLSFLQTELRGVATLLSMGLIASGFVAVATQRPLVEQRMRSANAQVQQAEATVIDSENRFRALVNQFTDPLYCFEFRPPIEIGSEVGRQVRCSYAAVLVDCNEAFARELGYRRPAQALGMRLDDLSFADDPDSYESFFAAFVDAGYRLADYDLSYGTPDGAPCALQIHARGVIEDGALTAAWISHRNVLAARQTEEALEVRERFQEVLGRISTRLLTTRHGALGDALTMSLGDVCRHVDAECAAVFWFESTAAEPLYEWSDGASAAGTAGCRAALISIGRNLQEVEPIVAATIDELPAECVSERRQLAEHGVKSIAFVPLIVEGSKRGCCVVANTRVARAWTERNSSDLQVFGELLASSISRLKSRQRLDSALRELELAKDRLEAENVYLQEEILSTHGFREIVGESPDLKHCLRQVAQVAETRTPVLIQGETGTGKELIARAVHERSLRSGRPLVKVNCAALPASLIESELFGHEAGAFTGAQNRKRGRFDLADGGTLFLDEIGDFPLELQGKILRVLQDGEFQRLGGTDTIRVDVRIIAATNRDLMAAVERGDFRADLYYRINTFTIALPPLRERFGDIPLLAQHFVEKHAPRLGKRVREISRSMREELEGYAWPGNVRELESVVQRSLLTSRDASLSLEEPLENRDESVPMRRPAGPLDLQSAEIAHIRSVLEQTGWRIAGDRGAAERLGLHPSTLRSRMKRLGISRRAVS